MTRLSLLFVLLAASFAAAEPLDVSPEAYREAAARGDVGGVSGYALTEGPMVREGHRPGAGSRPASEVSVTIGPYSERLLQQLGTIRGRARSDVDALRESAVAVAEARRAWERALWQAGAAELVRYTPVDPDGRFTFEALPAGQWLLIAQRAVFVPKEAAAASKRDRDMFVFQPRFLGYYVVTVWVRQLTVEPGQWTEIELTDRNAWMTALAEERERKSRRP